MRNIIRMDYYRLVHSKSFKINMLLVFFISLMSKPITMWMFKLMNNIAEQLSEEGNEIEVIAYPDTVMLSSLLCDPFGYTILIVLCLICMIGFAYADIANGYIKNYAGQLTKKGNSIISKFTVIGILNMFFMIAALAGSVIGELLVRKIECDPGVPQAVGTFFLKFLLLQSLCTILLFFTAGIKQKTIATVAGVVLGSGMLGLAYMGLNSVIEKVFKLESFNINDYAPDSLLVSGGNLAAANALLVSVVIIAVFLPLTVRIFNKSDVK